MPQACGIVCERSKEILVERIALAVDPLLLGHLPFEPPALLGGIGEFAKAVGEFHAAGIKLEALGDAPIVARAAPKPPARPGIDQEWLHGRCRAGLRSFPPARG